MDAGGIDSMGLMALYFGAVNGIIFGVLKFVERFLDKRSSSKHTGDGYLGCKVGSGDIGKLSDLMRQNIELQKNMIDEQGRLRKDNCDDHLRILRRLDNERSNP